MSGLTPTDEQAEAIRLAMAGDHLLIEAGAGAGKTSTAKMIATSKGKNAQGMYLAFNSAIVRDVKAVFPTNTECVTTHALAFRTHGRPMSGRLNGPRMKSADIARTLQLDPLNYAGREKTERAAPGFLSGFVMKGIARFCQTADPEPRWFHIPTPDKMRATPETRASWDDVKRYLEPKLKDAWADLRSTEGRLPFSHDCYRKQWALDGPVINADFILLDEAQDSATVLLGVLNEQRDRCQLAMIGDTCQAIYGWAGAEDVMEKSTITARARLSQSFRFGEAIAAEANGVLSMLPTDMWLTGIGPVGRVGPVEFPDVILTRTNSVAVAEMFKEIARGGKPHIVGGATDVLGFCEGALKLKSEGWCAHPELVCFNSWAEVQQYVSDDVLGEDLKMLVKLVDEYGAEKIISALKHMPSQDMASLVLSTGHKSKGLEFGSVKLAHDFPDEDEVNSVDQESLKLLYVAVTRAKRELDVESVGLLRPPPSPHVMDEPLPLGSGRLSLPALNAMDTSGFVTGDDQ